MPCKHQQYTATRLSGPLVFASPYEYNTSNLIQAVKDSIDPSRDEFKSSREDILYNTKVVRKNDNGLSLTPELSLPFKAASSLGNFAATTRTTHDPAREIDYNKPPYIILPSRGTFSTNSSPGDDVSALLEATIDLYLQWYSCRKPSCLNNITACGKVYRGQAWQKIANILEKSEMMRDMQSLIGSQGIKLLDEPRLLVSSDLIRTLGMGAWTVEDLVYAAEEERRKRVIPGVRLRT
ncbi:hypothetical protein BCON_0314g00130 [Botryotinia convoluta]|uniref:Uncharacterized protein n=1 Tax=Botryotinia convoluta TaxID=54673 RepID=A0A4Z1HE22_9HELO|nr:hypothetical protein BCON_0314g00130 [Botryotinia convoluta]